MQNGAYAMLQMTKPQTLAFGLNDSPVGWAAWSMTLLSDPTEARMTRDEMLTNIMIYWVTQTIASSVRSYFEGARAEGAMQPGDRVEVPSAVARCELDAPLPREWANRQVNLQYFSQLPAGHFAAWEAPEAFVNDLREAFRVILK
jgi:epoxide hydrolase